MAGSYDREGNSDFEKSLSRLSARIDNLEASNKATIASLEGRLNNYEGAQKAAATRLDDVYKSFMDRLSANDATVKLIKDMSDSIQKQSEAIQHQLGLRFNFITGMTGFIALAFAASFTYNIFQVGQVNQAKSFLEDGTEVLTADAIKYSDVLSGLAKADAFSTQGDREFLRGNYFDALNMAEDAIRDLEPLLDKTGESKGQLMRETHYQPSTCERVLTVTAHPNAPLPDRVLKSKEVEDRFGGLGPQSLRPAVEQALFAAYDLHARATFFAKEKEKEIVRQDGEFLLALDGLSSKWQGYHWIGLAAEGGPDIKEATACFEHSVSAKPVANKDYINLAELLFIAGHYDAAVSQGEKYLQPDYNRFGSPVDVVAQFYVIASNVLSRKPQRDPLPPSQFIKKLGELPNLSLEGTFLSSDLQKALDESGPEGQPFKQQEAAKKAMVDKMAACLIKRQCET